MKVCVSTWLDVVESLVHLAARRCPVGPDSLWRDFRVRAPEVFCGCILDDAN